MSEVKEKFRNLIGEQNLHIFDGPFVIENFLKNVEDYLNWNTLNEAINSDFVEWELISKDTSEYINIPQFVPYWSGRQQNKQYILDHVNNGTTFIISRCCILNDNLKSLVSDIQKTFPVACDIHIYGSKGNSKSFIPHSDRPNNFIIQAIGDTDWIVFKNRVSNILLWDNYANYEPKRGELTPALEVTLSPGDLLYIPPRTYHAALPSMPRLSMSIPSIPLDYKDLLQIHPNLDQIVNQLAPDVNKYEI
tara:strand:+ start:1349 stop:2095 length:747 start_codon:yes stop_codon:yes gene_type:complete